MRNIMSKPDMILLYGKSGAGKSYLVKTLNLKQVVSHTTRPIRKDEVDGVDKHFETTFKPKNIVAHNKRGPYDYWTTKEDLKGKDVYVIDIPGVEMLLRGSLSKEYNFIPVYIDTSLLRRTLNMIKRGETIKEIIARFFIDQKAFKYAEQYAKRIIKI